MTLSSAPALIFSQFPNARLVPPQRRWPNTPPSHTPVSSPGVKPIDPPRESPLASPHLSADPCPACGATTRTRLSFPSASSLHSLCVGKGEGNQTTRLRRQRSPRQGRSLNRCDDEVLGHSEGGPGVTHNLDPNAAGKKREAFT